MRIITTTNLLTKYNITNDAALALLRTLSPDVDILDTPNCTAIKAHCDTINDEILLVGGHDIVPFFILQNPSHDVDPTIYSDAPYACTQDPLYYIPDKVVGRLPDEHAGGQFDFLQTVINNQRSHQTTKVATTGWYNLVASVWTGISVFMSQTFGMNDQNVAPPTLVNTVEPDIIGKKFYYLNLHGSQQTPYFYGQGNGGYPIALAPKAGYFKDGVVFSDACYGAWLQDRNRNTSIPLMALYSGAIGFVGSTEVAYGPSAPPVDGADALSMLFYQHLIAGEPIGLAFMHAKQQFSTMLIARDGNLQPSNLKTLLEFNLYAATNIAV